MGISLCKLDKRSCMLCIASALVASYLLRLPYMGADATVSMATLFLLPFIMYAACRPLALDMLAVIREAVPPAETSITQPASFVPFAHGLFVAIFIFRIAYGFALTFGSIDGNPQQTFFGLMPIAILLVMALLPKVPKADVLYQAAALFVVGGFLAVVVLVGRAPGDMAFANGLLYAGSECFDALMWFVLASIGARNKVNALAVFAWGRAASSAGLLCGATVGHAVNATPDPLTVSVGIAVVLFLFVAMNFTVLKPFGFQATIDGVQSVEPVAAAASVGLPEKSAAVAAVPADAARDRAARAAGARAQRAVHPGEARAVAQHGEDARGEHLRQAGGSFAAGAHRSGGGGRRSIAEHGSERVVKPFLCLFERHAGCLPFLRFLKLVAHGALFAAH